MSSCPRAISPLRQAFPGGGGTDTSWQPRSWVVPEEFRCTPSQRQLTAGLQHTVWLSPTNPITNRSQRRLWNPRPQQVISSQRPPQEALVVQALQAQMRAPGTALALDTKLWMNSAIQQEHLLCKCWPVQTYTHDFSDF